MWKAFSQTRYCGNRDPADAAWLRKQVLTHRYQPQHSRNYRVPTCRYSLEPVRRWAEMDEPAPLNESHRRQERFLKGTVRCVPVRDTGQFHQEQPVVHEKGEREMRWRESATCAAAGMEFRQAETKRFAAGRNRWSPSLTAYGRNFAQS